MLDIQDIYDNWSYCSLLVNIMIMMGMVILIMIMTTILIMYNRCRAYERQSLEANYLAPGIYEGIEGVYVSY